MEEMRAKRTNANTNADFNKSKENYYDQLSENRHTLSTTTTTSTSTTNNTSNNTYTHRDKVAFT